MSLRKSSSRLNNKVIIRSGGRSGLSTREVQNVTKTQEDRFQARRKQERMLATMSFEQREEYEESNDTQSSGVGPSQPTSQLSGPELDTSAIPNDSGPLSDDVASDDGMDVDDPEYTELPLGEEGVTLSHAGGEYFFNQMVDDMLEHHPQTMTLNETLLRHGYIGASATRPNLAFPLSLLEIYRQVHRVCPRFSIDGLSKVLQYLHGMARETYLEDQLRIAYDEYLAILREVNNLSLGALERQSEASQIMRICPPCTYRVKNEAPLVPSILLAMDGNNSLKQVDPKYRSGQPREDDRELVDHRWLEEDFVDQFKDEVKKVMGPGPYT
ncbi:hypothetical protein VNI00_009583 [Paramarasmius palmivorus]|uniref:Uncharacterized protein n=1 Tax=Paramarasmius palmivorus TaxID=297713 RepID=A0AAW0CNW9_9AGAR